MYLVYDKSSQLTLNYKEALQIKEFGSALGYWLHMLWGMVYQPLYMWMDSRHPL